MLPPATDTTVTAGILAVQVVSTLVAPFGHEVYIKKPILYVPEGAKLTGWQVETDPLHLEKATRSSQTRLSLVCAHSACSAAC